MGPGQAWITAAALLLRLISSHLFTREPQCPLICDVGVLTLPSSQAQTGELTVFRGPERTGPVVFVPPRFEWI